VTDTDTNQGTAAEVVSDSKSITSPTTPGRCFRGAVIAAGLAVAMYALTKSMITVLAGVAIPTSPFAANISLAVRTLVIGVSTLATGLFAMATLGLVALGIKLTFKP
jgi:membrane-associated PAP2 superfamily phosphatase